MPVDQMSFECAAITTETLASSANVCSTHQPHTSECQRACCREAVGAALVVTPAAYITDCNTA